ncbi:hypothetical protein ACKWTF_016740 [Chironomus riparius]
MTPLCRSGGNFVSIVLGLFVTGKTVIFVFDFLTNIILVTHLHEFSCLLIITMFDNLINDFINAKELRREQRINHNNAQPQEPPTENIAMQDISLPSAPTYKPV